MTPDQIAELKRIAEAAANAALGDWRANFVPEGDSDGLTGYAPDGTFSRVGDFGERDLNLTHEDVALHIDAFDPPTCLALIAENAAQAARIEALEAGTRAIFDVAQGMNPDQSFNAEGRLRRCAEHAANLLGDRHD